MNTKIANPQAQLLYVISAVILFVGLSSALIIYLTAVDPTENPMIQDFENSKSYVHDLELFGGKMNVLGDQFQHWLDSLWHGKPLAKMIACITILLSSCCSFVAYHLPAESGPDEHDRYNLTEPRPPVKPPEH